MKACRTESYAYSPILGGELPTNPLNKAQRLFLSLLSTAGASDLGDFDYSGALAQIGFRAVRHLRGNSD